MDEIRVQDEQGNVHVFPQGSTSDMIAKAMNVKPPGPVQPSMSAGTQTFDQAHPNVNPQPGIAKRFASGAGIPTSQYETSQAVQGLLTPQADPAEQDKLVRAEEQIPILGGDFRARADLAKRAANETGAISTVHKVASFVPLVGPAVTAAQDKYDQGDYSGAVGAGFNALLSMEGLRSAVTPKPIGAKPLTPDTINSPPVGTYTGPPIAKTIPADSVRSSAAQAVVKPLVRKLIGQTLQDIKFGKNPAQALTDEGLVGMSKDSILTKAQARTGELSDAINQTLQNHPNSAVQIDAAPIIDNAIDNAASAAKKTGNHAAVTRLENLRTALKTEYGPTQGTPFEMSNLKREIGQVGSDLGAFKSTDPVEASAAAAMGDVYTGLKNAVNAQVPEAAPLNERVANLIGAQTALKRNIALASNKSIFDDLGPIKTPAKIVGKIANSAPVRTGVARVINAGNTLDVPQVNPIAQSVAPVGRQLGQGAIITPPPVNPSGSVPFNAPPIAATSRAQRLGLILSENATPEPIRLGSGPDTSGSVPNAKVPPIAVTSRAQRLGLVLPERIAIEAPAAPPQEREGLLPAASRIDPTTGRLQYLTSPAKPGAPAPIARPTQEGPRAIPAAPEPPQSAPVAAAVDKRIQYPDLRAELGKMPPAEQERAVFISDKTGLPNRRAFEIAQKNSSAPTVAMSDADGLKTLNDTYGYGVGDAMLKAKAEALKEAGLEAYHDKGDEFMFRGNSPEELQAKMENARNILRNRIIEAVGTDGQIHYFNGADFSYGTGSDLAAAEKGLKLHKAGREAAGQVARSKFGGIKEIK